MKKDKNDILQEVLELEKQCNSIIDAIVTVCERYSVEIETVAQYIKYSKDIKERVRQEGITLKMLET